MQHFIYVFSDKARDTLAEMGYRLFQSDDRQHVFVFLQDESLDLTKADVSYILSDSLTL